MPPSNAWHESVDHVLVTWSLCTIPDVAPAIVHPVRSLRQRSQDCGLPPPGNFAIMFTSDRSGVPPLAPAQRVRGFPPSLGLYGVRSRPMWSASLAFAHGCGSSAHHGARRTTRQSGALANYFHDAIDDHLRKLGVDHNRLLAPEEWHSWRFGSGRGVMAAVA